MHRFDPATSRWGTTLGPQVALAQYRGQYVPISNVSVRVDDAVVIVADGQPVTVRSDGTIRNMEGVSPIPGGVLQAPMQFVASPTGRVMNLGRTGLVLSNLDGTWTPVETPTIKGETSFVNAPVGAATDGQFMIQLQHGTQPSLWRFRPN